MEDRYTIKSLLEKAMKLSEDIPDTIVRVDYGAITSAVIASVIAERKRVARNPKVLLTQNEAHNRYGKSVITALVRRRYLLPYKFDLVEVYDENEELIKKAKGVVYYRVVDIEEALEDGNVLKCLVPTMRRANGK